ncbi:MAG: hypothetical protein AD742_01615 [Methylibium sp. NZG]|nr:MAG: hypothetical protein AD742_01615 [Methylibium sp. NZG]
MKTLSCLIGMFVLSGCAMLPSPVAPPLPSAAATPPSEWMEYALPGKRATHYTQVILDGRPVVHATANAAASVLRRKVRLEPSELGTVHFSWRVAELIHRADLSDRDQSDSPARLILAFDGDHSRLTLRNQMTFDLAQAVSGERPPFATLMYVWDAKAAPETVIHSGRTDRVRKIVVESGGDRLGKWRHYERDIAADFRKSFGEEPGALVSVGLMTDADNTRAKAEAWYGEVRLKGSDGRAR